jgi:murein DD-endopeptidase MepM/ murein hydrolase activator NlpD
MKASSKRLVRRVATVSALALVLVGCQQRLGGLAPLSFGGASGGDKATSAGGAIVVNQGDSLYVISRRYDVPLRDLIEINKLSPPYNIEPGQRLVLPTARQYIVQPGDTLYGVSRMFAVDVSELTRLNNLTPPYAIKSGQPLRLPSPAAGYGGDGPTQLAAAPRPKIERSEPPVSSAPASATPAPVAPAPVANVPFNAAAPSVVYQPGQEPKGLRPGGSLPPPPVAAAPPASSVAPPPSVPPADAPTNITLKPGKKPVPVTETPAEPQNDPAPEPAKEQVKEPAKEPAKEKPRDVAAALPPAQAKPAPAPAATVAPPPPAVEAEPPPRAAGRFLMPVKGSIISGFGPKPGGQHNDGLNIAASKGTAVIAADNGVVAYAGNELRGFGNLLLIRHADGWVTAYAHLDHIDVERGAEVKRGQKIGGVGQSGGVPTPQLHFEVRKGSQAVDPKGQM